MNTGAVRVFFGMLPATRITLPISPRQRENVRSVPATIAERIAGSTTRRKVARGPAPSVAAASSSAGSSSWSTGWTFRTTSGSVTVQSAITMAIGVNKTRTPRSSRNRPKREFGP